MPHTPAPVACEQPTSATTLLRWSALGLSIGLLGYHGMAKLVSAPVEIALFEQLGLEPLGRYAAGVGEVLATLLLLVPALRFVGAVTGLGVMSGAIVSHLSGRIALGGIWMALLVAAATAWIAWEHRAQAPWIGRRWAEKSERQAS